MNTEGRPLLRRKLKKSHWGAFHKLGPKTPNGKTLPPARPGAAEHSTLTSTTGLQPRAGILPLLGVCTLRTWTTLELHGWDHLSGNSMHSAHTRLPELKSRQCELPSPPTHRETHTPGNGTQNCHNWTNAFPGWTPACPDYCLPLQAWL